MTFAKASYRPAQQGQLDGFCGVYSIVNFFSRRLGIEPESDEQKKIFRRLLTLLQAQGRLTPSRIAGGGFREGQLQKAFNKLAAEKNLKVKAWALKSYVGRTGAEDICDVIARLGTDEAAMIHLDKCDHWVLAHSGTENRFTIDDSSEEAEPKLITRRIIAEYEIELEDGLVFLNA